MFRLVARIIYFFYFQVFTPKGLDQAQAIVLAASAPTRVQPFTVEGGAVDSLVEVKSRRLCFSSKYNFMPTMCRFMRMSEMGSMGCISSTSCASVDLEHIFLCHDDLNIPNRRCDCCYDCTDRKGFMVGFHQTSRDAALCISMSPMRKSEGENGWFGDGVYFARCLDQTWLKIGYEGGKGALIVALIDMGKMKTVTHQRETNSARAIWGGTGRLPGYDSVYVTGQGIPAPLYMEENDEFLVYDPEKIVSFIVCI